MLAGGGRAAVLGRVPARLGQVVFVFGLAGRDEELGGGPVELVADVAVAVDAAALDLRFGARVRVLLRGGVRGLGGGQAARRERGVQLLPHARRLRAGGGQVQRRRRADRAQVALDVVLVRASSGSRTTCRRASSGAPCRRWAVPAAPAACSSASRPKRASSSRSGLPFLPSGMVSLPSPKSPDGRCRSGSASRTGSAAPRPRSRR